MHLVCGNNLLLYSDLRIVILLINPLKFKVGSNLFRITFPQIFWKMWPGEPWQGGQNPEVCVTPSPAEMTYTPFYTPELDTLQKKRSPVPGRRPPCLWTSGGFLAALRLIGSTLASLFSFTFQALPKLQKLCGKKSFNFHSQCVNSPPASGNDFFSSLIFWWGVKVRTTTVNDACSVCVQRAHERGVLRLSHCAEHVWGFAPFFCRFTIMWIKDVLSFNKRLSGTR